MVDPKTGKNVKEFLNSFVEEYINANFKHKGRKIMRTNAAKRERYRSNNSRNKDTYTKEKAQGALRYTEDIKDLTDNEDTFDMEQSIDDNKGFYFWDEAED